jgi:type II secretory pathway component PulM
MDPRQRNALALVAIIVLVAVAWWQFWPPQDQIR